MATLTVESRALGRKRPLLPDWTFSLPASLAFPSLRELIGHVVQEEVARYQERQAEERVLRVLTEREIAEGAARGRVSLGGREPAAGSADPEAAVAAALQGFTDGLYLVFVDGKQVEHLDEPVALRTDTRLTFVRLMLLAGG